MKDWSKKAIFKIYDISNWKNPLWAGLVFLLLQEVISASSSVWLTQLAHGFENRQILIPTLCLFLLSISISYIPGALQTYFTQLWSLSSQKKFWQMYLRDLEGKPQYWTNSDLQNQKTSLAVREGPQIIHDTCYYIFGAVSLIINLVLNIAVIVWLLDMTFLIAFLIGFSLSLVLVFFVSPKIQQLAQAEELQRLQLNAPIMSAWDNLILGNNLSLKNWYKRFLLLEDIFIKVGRKNAFFRETMTASLSMVSIIPVVICIVMYVLKHSQEFDVLLALTVLLQKLFAILSYGNSFIYHLRDTLILKGRWNVFFSVWRMKPEVQLQDRIQEDKIQLKNSHGQKNISARELLSFQQREDFPTSGYWTITGDNGSGKTTLLIYLKYILGEQCFYLPAKHQLLFAHGQVGSTGQKMIYDIDEVFLTSESSVLLLDEWDAHLDSENRQKIQEKIRQVSEKLLVIDVRHRKDDDLRNTL